MTSSSDGTADGRDASSNSRSNTLSRPTRKGAERSCASRPGSLSGSRASAYSGPEKASSLSTDHWYQPPQTERGQSSRPPDDSEYNTAGYGWAPVSGMGKPAAIASDATCGVPFDPGPSLICLRPGGRFLSWALGSAPEDRSGSTSVLWRSRSGGRSSCGGPEGRRPGWARGRGGRAGLCR